MPHEFSNELAQKIHNRFRERQPQLISLIRAIVETESPSGDEAGSRAVVDLLASAAASARSVNSIERVDVPNFGQHLIIRACQNKSDAGVMPLEPRNGDDS